MSKDNDTPLSTQVSSKQDITQFIEQVSKLPTTQNNKPGRIIFSIDATASRQPTWDTACQLQAEMFKQTQQLGGILTQLCYYRGFHEFHHSAWYKESQKLLNEMQTVYCLGGHTQIGRLFQHALNESRNHKIDALIFVGDAMEESTDQLCHLAGQLGLSGVPAFIFHEGNRSDVAQVFKQMAKLSQGAYCPFDNNSRDLLAELLGAVAVYAAGGLKALRNHSDKAPAAVKLLTQQLGKS